jgi:hypothetical protein
MTRLVWGLESEKRYETGTDRGVLYPPDAPGVVWNGLTNVEESFIGGEVTPFHYDGIKYLDFVAPRHYQAVLTAYSAPEEFQQFVGRKAMSPGFIITRQPRVQFGLSYRTKIEPNRGYKIHLVYNALASPNSRSHSSLNADAVADTFSWRIDAVPPLSDTHRPSAHFIFDSTKTDPMSMAIIESILYGTDDSDPRLPLFEDLVDIVVIGDSLLVVPDTISGLADLTPGDGDLYTTSRPGIHRALPGTRLHQSDVDGLYELEE